jgi:phage-related protein
MKSSLGTALLPVVGMVSAALGTLAKVAGEHPAIFQAVAAAILVTAAAVLALAAASKVYAAGLLVVQVIQKATWLSNPITLVILAVIALVAAIVILWKKSATFRAVMLAMWAAIRTAASAVANAVKATWSALFTVLGVYVRVYSTIFRAAFSAIRAVASAAASGVKAAWSGVSGAVGTVANHIRDAMVKAFNAVKAAASGVASALSAPFNAVKSAVDAAINAVKSLIGWLGKIKVPHISIPHIPGLGRSVAAPSGAVSRMSVAGDVVGRSLAAPRVAAPAATSSGGVTIVVQGALDPDAVARQIQRLVGGHTRRIGVNVA